MTDNINTNKIVVYNKVSLVKKNLNILLVINMLKKLDLPFQKMSLHRTDFDKAKCMSFLIEDEIVRKI